MSAKGIPKTPIEKTPATSGIISCSQIHWIQESLLMSLFNRTGVETVRIAARSRCVEARVGGSRELAT